MRFLHTMVRIHSIDDALAFWRDALGLAEVRRFDSEKGRYTLIFMAAEKDLARSAAERAPEIELTYNWPDAAGNVESYGGGRNFGHVAFKVDDIHRACRRLAEHGVIINRPPRDGAMAFVRSPDGISVELLQKGAPLTPEEPWISMPNTGSW